MKKENGITLVALIITIIILLILATVSISLVINNGILDKAKYGVDKYSEQEELEQIKLAVLSAQMLGNGTLTTDNLNEELQANFDNDETVTETSKGWNYKGYKIDKDGNVEKNLLPVEYQQVEYIESTGTQYINISDNTKYPYWKMNFQMSEIPDNEYIGIFGRMYITSMSNGTGSRSFAMLIKDNGYFAYKHTYDNGTIANLSISNTDRHSVHCTNTIIAIDNNTYSINTKTDDRGDATISSFCIFALSERSNVGDYKSKMKLYSLKLYNNQADYDADEPNYDFVPCYRKSDNVIGMYDTVEGKFYTNQGTGEFLKGPDV